MSPHNDTEIPWTQEEADKFKQQVLSDDIVRGLLVSEDGQAMSFFFNSLPLGEDSDQIIGEWEEIVHTLDPYVDVYLNGSALLAQRLGYYLSRDLTILLGLCLVVILIIFYLSFHAKRAVLIPFSMSIIGLVWTLGTMVLLGYELTIVNIITPCMVLILSSSYSIHVITEYYTTHRRNGKEPFSVRFAASLSSSARRS
jgi:predicted RND superfamily exporter protein